MIIAIICPNSLSLHDAKRQKKVLNNLFSFVFTLFEKPELTANWVNVSQISRLVKIRHNFARLL